jgi:hypothetical protein
MFTHVGVIALEFRSRSCTAFSYEDDANEIPKTSLFVGTLCVDTDLPGLGSTSKNYVYDWPSTPTCSYNLDYTLLGQRCRCLAAMYVVRTTNKSLFRLFGSYNQQITNSACRTHTHDVFRSGGRPYIMSDFYLFFHQY